MADRHRLELRDEDGRRRRRPQASPARRCHCIAHRPEVATPHAAPASIASDSDNSRKLPDRIDVRWQRSQWLTACRGRTIEALCSGSRPRFRVALGIHASGSVLERTSPTSGRRASSPLVESGVGELTEGSRTPHAAIVALQKPLRGERWRACAVVKSRRFEAVSDADQTAATTSATRADVGASLDHMCAVHGLCSGSCGVASGKEPTWTSRTDL